MAAELSDNARRAVAVIEAAIEAGVSEWVVGAGARNLPLLETLLAMAEEDRGRVWNFFEERSAAFFALGRARRVDHRVAVITTSGTAAAELLPATIEAHYSGVPLLLITADRPPEFRGTGAPQSIEQRDLLLPYVWRAVDFVTAKDKPLIAEGRPGAGPEHWNVCLHEPAAGDGDGRVASDTRADRSQWREANDERNDSDGLAVRAFCSGGSKAGPLAVLVGELSAAEQEVIEPALAQLGAPLWAEATSGLRESKCLRPLMPPGGERGIAALNPKRVLRLGGVPSLRLWRDLETLPDVEVLSMTGSGFSGLARDSEVIVGVAGIAKAGGVEVAHDFSAAGDPLDEVLERFPASEPAVFRALSERIDSEALVFLGNSLPIREWNLAATFDVAHRRCFANRGANGIDGQLSTFLGMSAEKAKPQGGAWGIFGDLTTLYDLSAPWVVPQLAQGSKRRIVVINNGGGRIFDRLPAVQQGSERQAEVIRNPHAHGFEHWAAMWKMAYACWEGGAADTWREPDGEAVVIEIRPDEAQTKLFWEHWDSLQ